MQGQLFSWGREKAAAEPLERLKAEVWQKGCGGGCCRQHWYRHRLKWPYHWKYQRTSTLVSKRFLPGPHAFLPQGPAAEREHLVHRGR